MIEVDTELFQSFSSGFRVRFSSFAIAPLVVMDFGQDALVLAVAFDARTTLDVHAGRDRRADLLDRQIICLRRFFLEDAGADGNKTDS